MPRSLLAGGSAIGLSATDAYGQSLGRWCEENTTYRGLFLANSGLSSIFLESLRVLQPSDRQAPKQCSKSPSSFRKGHIQSFRFLCSQPWLRSDYKRHRIYKLDDEFQPCCPYALANQSLPDRSDARAST